MLRKGRGENDGIQRQFSGSIRDGHYKLRVDWSQSKNVSANTSTVTCKLYLVNDWSLNISGRSDNTCTIDGSAQTFPPQRLVSRGHICWEQYQGRSIMPAMAVSP